MSILEVKNLKKNFGSLEVLKGIDFSLEKGEALAMIGASGSGKTTLLRCLNFLERPTHGQIIVCLLYTSVFYIILQKIKGQLFYITDQTTELLVK